MGEALAGRSGVGRGHAADDQSAHVLEPGEIGLGVATVGSGCVLGRPQAITAIPRAQGGRGDPEAAGDSGNRQAGLFEGISGHLCIVVVGRRFCILGSVLPHRLFKRRDLTNL